MTDPIPVSQRAREAAASICSKPGLSDAILNGQADHASTIQAFARLEAAAYNDGLEAGAKVADQWPTLPIATAIRDLKGKT